MRVVSRPYDVPAIAKDDDLRDASASDMGVNSNVVHTLRRTRPMVSDKEA